MLSAKLPAGVKPMPELRSSNTSSHNIPVPCKPLAHHSATSFLPESSSELLEAEQSPKHNCAKLQEQVRTHFICPSDRLEIKIWYNRQLLSDLTANGK